MYKKTLIYVNAATGEQVSASGVAVIHNNDLLQLLRAEQVIACFQFLDVSNLGLLEVSNASLDPNMVFAIYGDIDFKPETPLMFLTEQSAENPDSDGVNDPGDWIDGGTADPARGQLSFRINTKNERFPAALGDNTTRKPGLVIQGIPPGEVNEAVLACFDFVAKNRPTLEAGAPPPAPEPGYLTANETLALLRSGDEYRFMSAVDSPESEWTSDPTAPGIRFSRSRPRATGGAWGDPVPLLEGQQGAGFEPDQIGPLAELSAHDGAAKGFSYLAEDTGAVYIKLSAVAADWSAGIPFRGPKGDPGVNALTVIADPVTEFPVYDQTWGYCRYLDATYTKLAFAARIRNLVRVRLEVVSANPAITGTVVLVPVVNGVDRDPVTINVGATLAEVVFDLAITSGTLTLRRIGGTLADGGMVTCIVTGIVLEV